MARAAASSARRVSAAPAFATRAMGEPSYGDAISTQSPVSTHSPPISSLRSVTVVAITGSLSSAA